MYPRRMLLALLLVGQACQDGSLKPSSAPLPAPSPMALTSALPQSVAVADVLLSPQEGHLLLAFPTRSADGGFAFKWTASAGDLQILSDQVAKWAPPAQPGRHSVEVEMTNGIGQSVKTTQKFTTPSDTPIQINPPAETSPPEALFTFRDRARRDTQGPVIVSFTPLFQGPPQLMESLGLSVAAYDPAAPDEPVDYFWASSGSTVAIDGQSTYGWPIPNRPGTHFVAVLAASRKTGLTSLAVKKIQVGTAGTLHQIESLIDPPIPNDLPPRYQGTVSLTAGNGRAGFKGDAGLATEARLNEPQAVVVDPLGQVFIADRKNNRVRKVDGDGRIWTYAGNGSTLKSGDGGPATQAGVPRPAALALDPQGNLFIASDSIIRKVDPGGTIVTVAGNGSLTETADEGVAGTSIGLYMPLGLATNAEGELYIASGNRVRKLGLDGLISTVAGDGQHGFAGDGGPAKQAKLSGLGALAFDQLGNLFVTDSGNGRIRMIDTQGNIQTVAGDRFAEFFEGKRATEAPIGSPIGLAIDRSGQIYVTGISMTQIRKVDSQGQIWTVVGNGKEGDFGESGPPLWVSLFGPHGLAFGPDQALYIADSQSHRVRKVTFQ